MLLRVAEPKYIAWLCRHEDGTYGFQPQGPDGAGWDVVGSWPSPKATMEAASKWRRPNPMVDRPWE